MKQLLLILALTTFSLATNPFQTILGDSYPKQNSKYFYAKKAAEKGNVNAQFDLAMMYGTGSEVKKNERTAFNWLHKSALNGHVQAKYLMGISFQQGTGVRVQKELARYWFKKAAKAGHLKAIFRLAKIERTLEKHTPISKYASNEF